MSNSFNYTVDTRPMADSIDSVSQRVNGTTAAVVTMQAAVIAAEKEGSDKVCKNVNRGFYSLMRSQISQKIASNKSRTEALLLRLNQQKRLLLSVKSNMEREYQRIAGRYVRIFTGINKELESRIRQVDQPVFEFVNRSLDATSNRMNALASWSTTMQAEALTQSQTIALSTVKGHAKKAIEQSADFIADLSEQRILAQKVLVRSPKKNETHADYVPAAIAQYVIDAEGHVSTDVRPPEVLSPETASTVRNTLMSARDFTWKGTLPKEVEDEFRRILASANVQPRVKQAIEKLFQPSATQTL